MKYLLLLLIQILFYKGLIAQGCLGHQASDDANHQFYKVMAPSGITVRAAPNRYSQKLGVIPFGEEILVCSTTQKSENIEGQDGTWLMLGWQHEPAYLFGGFLVPLDTPKIALFIPNSGIDTDWRCAGFDPAKNWTAILPIEEPDSPSSAYISQTLVLDNHVTPSDCASNETNHKVAYPSPLSKAPFIVFTGNSPKKILKNHTNQQLKLYPGAVETYSFWDARHKVENGYCIYAKGNVVEHTDNSNFRREGPFSGVKDYEIWLYHSEKLTHYSSSNKITKQCLYSADLDIKGYDSWDYILQSIFFVGDLDDDGKLDLILESSNGAGSQFSLYLSSAALPGFLLRCVATFNASGC